MNMPFALLIHASYYWLALILTSFIVALIGVLLFIQRSKRAVDLIDHLKQVDQELQQLDRLKMENTTAIAAILRENHLSELEDEMDRLGEQSSVQFGDEYFVDPRTVISTAKQLPAYRQLKANSNHLPLITGLVLTILLIAFQNFYTGSNALMLSSSTFPFLLGLLLSYLIISSASADEKSIDYQLDRVYEQIKMVVPVYNPEASSRLLIKNFVDYNDTLSKSAKELVASEVISGVSENLDSILKKDLLPSMKESSATLKDLADHLREKQENGMQSLATDFSAQLSQKLDDHFRPMGEQISHYTKQMDENHQRSEASMQLFNQHRESLDAITNEVRQTLDGMREERMLWRKEQEVLGQSLNELTLASNALNDLQLATTASLAEHFQTVADNLNRFTELNQEANNKLAAVTADFDALVRENMTENSHVLQDYRLLSTEIKTAARHMELSNSDLSQQLERLSESLDSSVLKFTTQIQNQVDGTLQDFDNGLAEMSLRLSHSATEMRDTANILSRQQAEMRSRGAAKPPQED